MSDSTKLTLFSATTKYFNWREFSSGKCMHWGKWKYTRYFISPIPVYCYCLTQVHLSIQLLNISVTKLTNGCKVFMSRSTYKYQGSHVVLKELKKCWIPKSVFQIWKSIEIGQNMHYVMKYGNSKWKRNLKYRSRILPKAK